MVEFDQAKSNLIKIHKINLPIFSEQLRKQEGHISINMTRVE